MQIICYNYYINSKGGAIMDWTTIPQLIGSLGFPIVMCVMIFTRMNEQSEQHKEETLKLTESLNNNTIAITQLTAKLEQTGVIQ
jgi:hypothetical protein